MCYRHVPDQVDMEELTQEAVMEYVEYRVDVYESFYIEGTHRYHKTAWFADIEEALEYRDYYNDKYNYMAHLSIDVKQEDVKEIYGNT